MALGLAACGSADEGMQFDQLTADDCLNCGKKTNDNSATDDGVETRQQGLTVSPGELMFYAEGREFTELPTRSVLVRNDGAAFASIVNIRIVDIPGTTTPGSAEYFNIAGFHGYETLTEAQEAFLDVEFLGSYEHQSALLVIETNHEEYPRLVVELSGRLFIGDSDW
jgi:hypothetical protein